MLHTRQVLRGLYYGSRIRMRRALGIKPRNIVASVLSGGAAQAIKRYERICRFYMAHIEAGREVAGQAVCEIGCGNSLTSADMLLGMGASRVGLIEKQEIIVNDVQKEVVKHCAQLPGLPNRGEIFDANGKISDKVTIINEDLEQADDRNTYSLLLSFDVMEHVEDIDGFFKCCHRMLAPGKSMLHKIDLSGHGYFEDPLPPLDFQTYPAWLYAWIFPDYKATRRLQEEYLAAVRKAGFEIEEFGNLTEADPEYIEKVRPQLRASIRDKTPAELKALDWFVKARKI